MANRRIMASGRPTPLKTEKHKSKIRNKDPDEEIVNISDDSDVDILYEEFTPLVPGTPAFILQQVSLLENLQRHSKHIPTDYKAFLDCVKSLKVNYQPAVILGAWKVLLDKHLSVINLGKNVITNVQIDETTSSVNCKHEGETSNNYFEGETSNNKKHTVTNNKSNFNLSFTNKLSLNKTHGGSLNSLPTDNFEQETLCSKNNYKQCGESGKHRKSINSKESDSLKNGHFELSEKCIKKKDSKNKEKMFIEQSVSCPEILITQNETKTKNKSSSLGRQNAPKKLKRKSDINAVSPSRRKRKSKESNTLEALCSSVIGNEKTKCKIKVTDKEKFKTDKSRLSKYELIKFFKKQSKEKLAEEKKLEKQLMEMYHERLVDVLVPKYYPSLSAS